MTNLQKHYLDLQLALLFPFIVPEDLNKDVPDNIKNLLDKFKKAEYEELLKTSELNSFFSQFSSDTVQDLLSQITLNAEKFNTCNDPIITLIIAITCLQCFVQDNQTGPSLKFHPQDILENITMDRKDFSEQCTNALNIDGEICYALVKSPFWLLLSIQLLNELANKFVTAEWWLARALFCHQNYLENPAHSIYTRYFPLLEKVINSAASWTNIEDLKIEMQVCSLIEGAIASHHYDNPPQAMKYLNQAQEIGKVSLHMTGVLGKRTKYQHKSLAQLTLMVENEGSEVEETGSTPQNQQLDDDTVLNDINYDNKLALQKLRSRDQIIILSACMNVANTNPDHGLTTDQMLPYVTRVLEEKENNNWMICALALLLRSRIEHKNFRKVERAVIQMEVLRDQFEDLKFGDGPVCERMKYIYSLPFPAKHNLERELGRLFLSIGSVRSARDIFERLELWEDYIRCLMACGDDDATIKFIKQRLEICENADIRCSLGDVTNNIEEYYTAWENSNHRCSRAMRSLGRYYLDKKEYQKAIDSFQFALDINPMFPGTWFSMGCAAMCLEEWKVAVKAMKQSLSLEVDNSDGWCNLGAIQLRLDQPKQAKRSFEEGLKFNRSSWKIWENLLAVSITLKEVNSCFLCVKEITRLQHKFNNMSILVKLIEMVIEKLQALDSTNETTKREMSKIIKDTETLLNSITEACGSDPILWSICARWYYVVGKDDKELEYLQKAYRASQEAGWEYEVKIFETMAQAALQLSHAYHKRCDKLYAHKGRLLLKGIVRKAKECYADNKYYKEMEELLEKLIEQEIQLKNNL